MLGRAKKVMIDKENTTSSTAPKEGRHRGARFADQGADLRKPPRTTTGEKLQERLAKLAGGVAVIRVAARLKSR